MDTISTAVATVVGARHVRAGRNGQDAAVAWRGGEAAVVVVADGCSSGTSCEVGARLGALVFARALGERIAAGAEIVDEAMWGAARDELVEVLATLADRIGGEREQVIRDQFLFTLVAAAVTPAHATVWAVGDGVYALGHQALVLGPFEDNQPPYVGYDLLGDAATAHFAIATDCDHVVIATDGATDIPDGLARFASPRFVTHPDALRRELAVLTRPSERIVWHERRVARAPAVLQDDCAVGVIRRREVA
jgi:hypothetical protein